MIVNNIIESIFNKGSNVRVLRALIERVVGISGRETARLSGVSLRSAQIALDNLENLKIVNRLIGGREHLFTLNRDNFVVQKIIIPLFESEQTFKEKLFAEIKNNLSALTESLIIFGSVARKEETIKSDLDLCIVYSKGKTKIEATIDELRINLNKNFGIILAPFLITKSEFRKRAKANKSPVPSILKEGKIISGLSLSRLKDD